MNHYETLGVARDATDAQIKRAYRKLAGRLHPDREGGDAERMQAINAAYAVLGDEARRAQYDATGSDREPVDTVRDEAQQIVVMIFRKIIDDGGSSNVLLEAGDHLRRGKSTLDAKHLAIRATLAGLRKQKGKVRAKRGDNLFEQLLDAQIASNEQALIAVQHGERVHTAALGLLADYECDSEPVPEPPKFSVGQFFFDPDLHRRAWR